jgi:hypothetical protein
VLDEGVNLADTIVKAKITDDVTHDTKPILDQELSDLKSTAAGFNSATQETNQSLLDKPNAYAEEMPEGIKNGIASAKQLENARANGKYSATMIDGKLDAVLSDLRGRYPGYRDHIDSEMQKVTGRNVANQYRQSLIADINAATASAKAEREKTVNMFNQAIEKNVPLAAEMKDQFLQTGDRLSADKWLNRSLGNHYQM